MNIQVIIEAKNPDGSFWRIVHETGTSEFVLERTQPQKTEFRPQDVGTMKEIFSAFSSQISDDSAKV